MAKTRATEYLSFGDSLFLYLERDGAPLNIASLAIFEGEIDKKAFERFVTSKLPELPRYLQKVVIPPLSVGSPYWEFATDFNLSDHVQDIKLRQGTKAELKRLVGKLLSSVMDRNHPLWDLTLIHGIKHGRTALLGRVHHSVADGISGMGILGTLMDSEPSERVKQIARPRVRLPKTQPPVDIVDSALRSWFSVGERLLRAGSEVLTLVQRASGLSENGNLTEGVRANGNREIGDAKLARLTAELSNIPERLPFNTLCHGPQRFEWTEAELGDFKSIREKCGATVNDVVLAVLTAAYSRYSELHGATVRGRSMRIVVPVSTRKHHGEIGELGNHITFAPFSAPMGIRNPKRLVAAIHERMQFVKGAHVADFVAFAGTLLGAIPAPLQAVLAPVISGLPITLCNTICTNVPGPKKPLYLMGHEMLSAYPYVPIGGEMGINCAVLSYNGKVYFGFSGDTGAAPDLEVLPKFVDAIVAEMKHAFGIRNPRARADAKSEVSATGTVKAVRAEPVTKASDSTPEPEKAMAATFSPAA